MISDGERVMTKQSCPTLRHDLELLAILDLSGLLWIPFWGILGYSRPSKVLYRGQIGLITWNLDISVVFTTSWQSHVSINGQCTLNINTINEKAFIFLWYFYIALGLLFVMKIVKSMFFLIPLIRRTYMIKFLGIRKIQANSLDNEFSLGNQYVLINMCEVISPSTFQIFLNILLKKSRNQTHKQDDQVGITKNLLEVLWLKL